MELTERQKEKIKEYECKGCEKADTPECFVEKTKEDAYICPECVGLM